MTCEPLLLEIQSLSAGYGKMSILWDVDLTIREGEPVALVGTNGSGKTTLMRVLCGLNTPEKGRVVFDGKEITGLSPQKRVEMGIALVPESREIFSRQSVLANLHLGAYSKGRNRDLGTSKEKRLQSILTIFPILSKRLKQMAGTLSGGEQQMLAIGRGLMSQPRLLVLDEPSTGLAPIVVKEIFRVLKGLIQGKRMTLFLVEQNTRLALKTVQKGYILERGRIVKSDHAHTLLQYLDQAGLIHG